MEALKRSTYEEIVIESTDGSKTVDIAPGTVMIDYYEDIFSPTLTANGSIEFVTGSGNGGFNNSTITGADPFTFVIDGVSQTGADGRGSLTVDRAQWSTSGAAHTGGTKALVHYPVGSGSATFLTPAASGDNTINVNT